MRVDPKQTFVCRDAGHRCAGGRLSKASPCWRTPAGNSAWAIRKPRKEPQLGGAAGYGIKEGAKVFTSRPACSKDTRLIATPYRRSSPASVRTVSAAPET